MSSSGEPAPKKAKVLEFGSEFGDMSPIDEFRGPKTPSNRQVLRMMLHFAALSSTLREAAKDVITKVMEKHTTAVCKSPRRLEDDIIALHSEARFINQQLTMN